MSEMLFELSENISKRVQLVKVGTFDHEFYGKFTIKLSALQEMEQHLKNNIRRQMLDGVPVLPLDYKHKEQDIAAGWIKKLEIDKDKNGIDSLFGEVDWTPRGARVVRDREFAFISPSIRPLYKDSETGKIYKNVLKGATLTNVPFLRDMEAVHLLSESRRAAFESLKLSGDSDFNSNQKTNMAEVDEIMSKINALPTQDIEKVISMLDGLSLEQIDKLQLACPPWLKWLMKKRAGKLHERGNMIKLSEDFNAMSPEEKEKFLAECGLVVKDKKLSEELDQFKKDLKKAQDDLKLSEDENEKIKEKISGSEELEDRLKLAETELKDQKEKTTSLVAQIAKKEKEGEFNKMLSEGKVCEAQREPFMKGDFADFAAKFEPIKLDESGSNDRNDEFKNAEDEIVKLAEEKMGKDKDLTFDNAVSLALSENPKLATQIN